MQGQAFRECRIGRRRPGFLPAAESHPLLGDYALFSQAEALQKMGEGEKSLTAFLRLVDLLPQSLLAFPARLRAAEIHFQSGIFRRRPIIANKF